MASKEIHGPVCIASGLEFCGQDFWVQHIQVMVNAGASCQRKKKRKVAGFCPNKVIQKPYSPNL